jgi:hypothetical protein
MPEIRGRAEEGREAAAGGAPGRAIFPTGGGSQKMMAERDLRVAGVVDHIAVNSEDLGADVREYERLGFSVETLYDDWAMLRDARGFGMALLGPGSKHPQHLGLRVESREELEEAARRENRPIKEHRDHTLSFYTKGIGGRAVEVIYYPPEFYERDK